MDSIDTDHVFLRFLKDSTHLNLMKTWFSVSCLNNKVEGKEASNNNVTLTCYWINVWININHIAHFQEDQNRGKPNWEHLSDELHVLLTVEDTENRAHIKLARAVEEVKKLLVPVSIIIVHTFELHSLQNFNHHHARNTRDVSEIVFYRV